MMRNVRTTLDLPEDVHRLARARAREEGIAMGEALARLVREALKPRARPPVRRGVPVMPARGFVLTDAEINATDEEA